VLIRFIVPEEHAIFGFVLEPELEEANSGLEFLVRFPKMHQMAAQGNFIVGDPERNLALPHVGYPDSDSTSFYISTEGI
jgi:hypothetical protein